MINLEQNAESEQSDQKRLLLKIEDEIIVHFCELNGGMEFAMPIIRKQFEKHNVDFKNPSKKDLYKITDTLVEVTLSIKGENVAREEKKIFKDLLLKLNGSE